MFFLAEFIVMLPPLKRIDRMKIIKDLIEKLIKKDKLPPEIICLSCLTTQSTSRIIANDNACVICDCRIDPYNLSDVEV